MQSDLIDQLWRTAWLLFAVIASAGACQWNSVPLALAGVTFAILRSK